MNPNQSSRSLRSMKTNPSTVKVVVAGETPNDIFVVSSDEGLGGLAKSPLDYETEVLFTPNDSGLLYPLKGTSHGSGVIRDESCGLRFDKTNIVLAEFELRYPFKGIVSSVSEQTEISNDYAKTEFIASHRHFLSKWQVTRCLAGADPMDFLMDKPRDDFVEPMAFKPWTKRQSREMRSKQLGFWKQKLSFTTKRSIESVYGSGASEEAWRWRFKPQEVCEQRTSDATVYRLGPVEFDSPPILVRQGDTGYEADDELPEKAIRRFDVVQKRRSDIAEKVVLPLDLRGYNMLLSLLRSRHPTSVVEILRLLCFKNNDPWDVSRIPKPLRPLVLSLRISPMYRKSFASTAFIDYQGRLCCRRRRLTSSDPDSFWVALQQGLSQFMSDGSNVVEAFRKIARANEMLDNLVAVVDVPMIVGVMQLLRAINVPDAILAVVQIGSSPMGRKLMVPLAKHVYKFFQKENVVQLQGEGLGSVKSALEFFKQAGSGSLSSKILAFIGALSASTFLGSTPGTWQLAYSVFLETTKDAYKDLDLFGKFLHMSIELFERLDAFRKSGDFHDLIGESRAVREMHTLSSTITNMETLMAGREPEHLDEYLSDAAVLIDHHVTNGCMSNPAKERLSKLCALVKMYEGSIAPTREVPVGVIMVGPPGIGKTSLVTLFCDVERAKLGLPADVDVKMDYDPVAKYQRKPIFTKVVVINDAFQTKDEHLQSSTITLFQALVDSAPFRLEMASLEEKAMANIAPNVVLASTNCENFLMSKATGGANKLDRRYVVAQFIWTMKAVDRANELGIVTDQLFRHTGGRTFEELGWVNITLREMRNADTNLLHLIKGSEIIEENVSINRVLEYSYHVMERDRLRTANAIGAAQKLCPECHLPLPHTGKWRCSSKVIQGRHSVEEPEEKSDISDNIAQELDDEEKARDWADSEYFRKPEPRREAPKLSYYQWMMGWNRLAGFVNNYPGLVSYWSRPEENYLGVAHRNPFLVSDNVSLALTALVGALILFRAIYSKKEKQGTVHGVVEMVAPLTSYVRPSPNANVPWLPVGGNSTVAVKLETGMSMYGLICANDCLVVPSHLFGLDPKEMLKNPVVMKMILGASVWHETVTMSKVFLLPNKDMAFVKLQCTPGGIQNIDRLLMRKITPGRGKVSLNAVEYSAVWDDKLVFYDAAQTVKGDCGLPVKFGDRIIGIHIALLTNTNQGIASSLSYEDVEACDKYFVGLGTPYPRHVDAVFGMEKDFQGGYSELSDFAWWAKSKTAEQVSWVDHYPVAHLASRDTSKMSGRKTKMFPVFGPLLTEPYGVPNAGKAKLINGEWVSAVTNRLNKTCPNNWHDPRALDLASEMLLCLVPQMGELDTALEPLSLYQSIAGDPRNGMMAGRNTDKAVGRTMAMNGVTKKNAFVEKEPGVWTVHPKVLEHVDFWLQYLDAGEIPFTVASATVKDELYPMSKVEEGKVRLFYVGDVAYNLVHRMYLLPLISYLADHPFDVGCIMTLNPGSEQWASLKEFICAFGESRLLDMDQSAFDLRHRVAVDAVCKVFYKLALKLGYSSTDANKVLILVKAGFRYLLFMEGNIFECKHRLNSGRPDTMVFNCVVNHLIVIYAWVRATVTEGPDETTGLYESSVVEAWTGLYKSEVRVAASGDDNLTSLKEGCLLKPEDMARYHAELGYTVTDADKKATTLAFKELSEVVFLKRKFVRVTYDDYTFWSAPLALDSVYKSLSYRTGRQLQEEEEVKLDLLNVYSATREMFLHGRVKYEEFLALIPKVGGDLEKIPTIEEMVCKYKAGLFQSWSTLDSEGSFVKDPLEPVKHSTPDADLLVSLVAKEALAVRDLGEYPSHENVIERQGRVDDVKVFTELNTHMPEVNSSMNAPITRIGGVSMDTIIEPEVKRDFRRKTEELAVAKFADVPRVIATFLNSDVDNLCLFTGWKGVVPVANILQNYVLFRGSPRVTISYSGNPSVQGTNRIYFVPLRNNADQYQGSDYEFNLASGGDPHFNLTKSSQFPHLDIDLSAACTCSIDLPYNNNSTFAKISTFQDWMSYWGPIADMESVSGLTPDPVMFEMRVSYHNVEFAVLELQGLEEEGQGPLTRGLGYAKGIADLLPFPFLTPVSAILGVGQGIARFFGWSRPPVEPSTAIVSRNLANFACVSGQPDLGYHLGLDPAVCHDVSGTFIPGASKEDTSLRNLVGRRSDIFYLGAGLGMQVTPGTTYENLAGWVQNTPLSFASLGFKYWTGSLKLLGHVACSPLVRMRIGVVIVPPGQALPGSYVDNGSALTTVIEVAGTTEFSVDVPYLYAEPFQAVAIVDATAVATTYTRVVWFVLAGPLGPGPSPPVPKVRVGIVAGEDFELGYPSLEVLNRYKVINQGDEGKPVTGPISAWTFGERVDDVRLLCKRFCMVAKLNTTALSGTVLQSVNIPAAGFPPFDNATAFNSLTITRSNWSFATWYKTAYLGWTGSNNWKVVCLSGAAVSAEVSQAFQEMGVQVDSPSGKFYTTNAAGEGVQVFGTNQAALEVGLPFKTPHLYASPQSYLDTSATMPCLALSIVSYNPLSTTGIFYAWHGAGDDFTFTGYMTAPSMKART